MKEEIVNKRMSELLLNDDFNLSIGYLCKLHKNLFKNVYVDCGIIRSYNVRKREMSLNGETIDYADNHGIITLLNMIFDREKVINYKSLNEEEIVEKIANFCAKIWLVHPFNEGNTRLVALYTQKYLNTLGFNVNNNYFKDNALYFRGALVRANYYNYDLGVEADLSCLIKFFKKLLINHNIVLEDSDFYVWELFSKQEESNKKR